MTKHHYFRKNPTQSTNLKLLTLTIILSLACEAIAQLPNTTFWRRRVSRLAFTTTAQSLTATNCSAIVTVQARNASGQAVNVGANTTVTLSGPATMTFFSDSACTTLITSVTITAGNSSANFYFLNDNSGTATYTASATSYATASQSATLSAYGYTWTGGGGNANWNTAANWSGGAAPGGANIAKFNSVCTSNCSPTINVAINISGIEMTSAYSGTITQGSGITITLGSGGFKQAGGTFIGSDAAMSTTNVIISAGSFTAPAATLTVTSNWTLSGTPTFNGNAGTIRLTAGGGCGGTTFTPGSVTYATIYFNNGFCHGVDLQSGTLKVSGTLMLGTGGAVSVNNGTVEILGDVTAPGGAVGGSAVFIVKGTGNQTINGSGSFSLPNLTINSSGGTVTFTNVVTIDGNYTYTAGTMDWTTNDATLKFTPGGGCQAPLFTAGAPTYHNVNISLRHCSYMTFGGGTLKVAGLLTLNATSANSMNNGTIEAYGNISSTGAGYDGTAIVVVKGSGNQTITGASSAGFPNLTINSTGGTVTFSGTIDIKTLFTYTAGTVDTSTNSSTVRFTHQGYGGSYNIVPGTMTFYNVEFAIGSYDKTFSFGGGTMTVANTLTFNNSSGANLSNVTFQALGNVVVTSAGAYGNGTLVFAGTSQTLTHTAGNLPTGGISVISGAAVTLAGTALTMSTAPMTITSGSFDMAGINLTLNSLSLNANTITKNA